MDCVSVTFLCVCARVSMSIFFYLIVLFLWGCVSSCGQRCAWQLCDSQLRQYRLNLQSSFRPALYRRLRPPHQPDAPPTAPPNTLPRPPSWPRGRSQHRRKPHNMHISSKLIIKLKKHVNKIVQKTCWDYSVLKIYLKAIWWRKNYIALYESKLIMRVFWNWRIVSWGGFCTTAASWMVCNKKREEEEGFYMSWGFMKVCLDWEKVRSVQTLSNFYFHQSVIWSSYGKCVLCTM